MNMFDISLSQRQNKLNAERENTVWEARKEHRRQNVGGGDGVFLSAHCVSQRSLTSCYLGELNKDAASAQGHSVK